jgi:hypothetical protein
VEGRPKEGFVKGVFFYMNEDKGTKPQTKRKDATDVPQNRTSTSFGSSLV